jgi:hypothetical protein
LLAPVAALVVAPVTGYATSFGTPERHDVFSPNGQFVLDVDPKTDTLTVYAVTDRNTPLWSFSKPIWHAPFFLSNDGKVVTSAAWKFVRTYDLHDTDCVLFRNKDGVFRSYSFLLC